MIFITLKNKPINNQVLRASGKAGGFIAKDWHRGPTASLAALSFDLHQALSDEYKGEERWAYRRVTTLQVKIESNARDEQVADVDWIDGASYYEQVDVYLD